MSNSELPPNDNDGTIEDVPAPAPTPPPADAAAESAARTSDRPKRDLPTAMVVGVRLRPGGRVVTCNAVGHSLRVGMRVMVQVERGTELGIVTVAPRERPVRGRLARITRVADERDQTRSRSDSDRAADALMAAREAAANLKLAVKMFHAEVGENGRATLYFASDARVELRDLARDLSNRLRLRVELRQVGVRDEAKMVGGIGSCGRELCCSTFLPRFAPVSIKAAKVQNIALTPSKVSGQCGRLKCCLVYEEANYVEAAKSLPRMGKRVETPDGIGRVGDLDVLRGRVRVLFQDAPPKVYESGEVKQAPPLPNSGGGASNGNDR
jgi:cell fate regulator YaaT (PSP1 superfamily)